MEIELGSDYTFDYECYNLFSDLSDKIVSTGNVDTSKIGNYKVRASVKYLFYNIKKDFIVKVVDKIPPDIELKGIILLMYVLTKTILKKVILLWITMMVILLIKLILL